MTYEDANLNRASGAMVLDSPFHPSPAVVFRRDGGL